MRKITALLLCLCCALALCAPAGAQGMDARDFYKALLAGGQEQELRALMNDPMREALSEQTLGALAGQLSGLGALVGFAGEPAVSVQGTYTVYILTAVMENGEVVMQYTLDENGLVAGLFFTQNERRLPYNERAGYLPPPEGVAQEDAVVDAGRYALDATLTLPADLSAPVPAVVLVHGSGPNDRDETAGQVKLFRDLAWALAKNGVASLRYDKRTYAYGGSMPREEMLSMSVYTEVIEDAVQAGKTLYQDARIDGAHIYVVGHSLGAMLAPQIVTQADGLFAGAALLSGTPCTLMEVILAQNEAALAKLNPLLRAVERVKLDAELHKLANFEDLTDEEAMARNAFGASLYYWKHMPPGAAETILHSDKPFLIVNGGADFQITDAQGIDAWRSALGDAMDGGRVTLFYDPTLNHMLMRYAGDPAKQYTTEEYDAPAALDADAAQAVADWLNAQAR